MTAQKMWEAYSRKFQVQGHYEAWAYGAAADQLAQLTLEGTKTATASAYPLYALEGESLPAPGQYSVVLNSRDEAVCIIRTDRVYVTPFHQVTEDHAWKEGEGDRSLSYWRQVHEDFFRRELEEAGLSFADTMPVVCEEFTRVYP